ncbi:hypothetical protein AALP_AAs56345U000100, partial [Arabis alpina]
MATSGTYVTEVPLKGSAAKHYKRWKSENHVFPDTIGHHIQDVTVHEGESDSHGSIRTWNYTWDGKQEIFKEKREVDDENKTLTLRGLEGHVMEELKVSIASVCAVVDGRIVSLGICDNTHASLLTMWCRWAGTAMAWSDFVTEFNSKFFPQEALDRLEARFLDLTQGTRSVREYDVEFNRLLGYAGRSFEDEQAQVRRFLRGLRPDLRTRCRGIRFAGRVELVEVAAQIEEDLREQAAIVVPAVQPRRPQQQQVQQAGPGKGGKPAQG